MSEEIIVVFYTDACAKHQREFFTGDTVCVKKTWKCDKCKESRYKVERPTLHGTLMHSPLVELVK